MYIQHAAEFHSKDPTDQCYNIARNLARRRFYTDQSRSTYSKLLNILTGNHKIGYDIYSNFISLEALLSTAAETLAFV